MNDKRDSEKPSMYPPIQTFDDYQGSATPTAPPLTPEEDAMWRRDLAYDPGVSDYVETADVNSLRALLINASQILQETSEYIARGRKVANALRQAGDMDELEKLYRQLSREHSAEVIQRYIEAVGREIWQIERNLQRLRELRWAPQERSDHQQGELGQLHVSITKVHNQLMKNLGSLRGLLSLYHVTVSNERLTPEHAQLSTEATEAAFANHLAPEYADAEKLPSYEQVTSKAHSMSGFHQDVPRSTRFTLSKSIKPNKRPDFFIRDGYGFLRYQGPKHGKDAKKVYLALAQQALTDFAVSDPSQATERKGHIHVTGSPIAAMIVARYVYRLLALRKYPLPQNTPKDVNFIYLNGRRYSPTSEDMAAIKRGRIENRFWGTPYGKTAAENIKLETEYTTSTAYLNYRF